MRQKWLTHRSTALAVSSSRFCRDTALSPTWNKRRRALWGKCLDRIFPFLRNCRSSNHAMDASIMERVLQRDRATALLALTAVAALAWAYVVLGAGMDMDSMLMQATMTDMDRMPLSAGYFGLLVLMWSVMMVAMMLPSAAPMILLFSTIERRRRQVSPFPATAFFVVGYLAVWAAFSIAATALQWGLEQLAFLSPMMRSTNALFAATVLIAAGIYQFTPLKRACLRRCRSPLEFITQHWKRGPFRMGLWHGSYCVGCCWMLMLLLFVGGVMNMVWVALIAMFILAEKLMPALIDLPCPKNARRIFAIVSTTSIPTSASIIMEASVDPQPPGSRLDADHPDGIRRAGRGSGTGG
jgi:predicted metal-binding membrane protein